MKTAQEIRAEYLKAFREAMYERALSAMPDTIWLLVWDKDGFCRAYSTVSDNFHFAVPLLNGKCQNFSSRFCYNFK